MGSVATSTRIRSINPRSCFLGCKPQNLVLVLSHRGCGDLIPYIADIIEIWIVDPFKRRHSMAAFTAPESCRVPRSSMNPAFACDTSLGSIFPYALLASALAFISEAVQIISFVVIFSCQYKIGGNNPLDASETKHQTSRVQ
ncbi:hypothetical protein BCR41DRAFT_372547 [Lobosporangium transversale]|uniref:Uncharacterized protein n=1 Tax=Lobosporangium transversale TaxID=64571 RepID=A0A1Y2GGQ0_9FUNG|nr:hypothetical protein BCR41DRAFT_372547 [Lobosporangium transversale]ORZ10370.1 hypothetical protein BCR41DRAFT_372547 [Lobosporangium transversale]|eukprot:XP_021879277.1 hypothetical protein BCR41DRAFT_372547 [Lobosporangium transversale]